MDHTLIALSESNFARIRDLLKTQGLVFFKHFKDQKQLIGVGEYLGEIFKHRDSDELGITYVKSSETPQSTGFMGFSSKGLPLHTDRSTESNPPNILILACKKESSVGGETLLSDGRDILRDLTSGFSSFDHPFIDRCSVIFDDSNDCFKGNIFTKEADGSYTMRYRRDDFAFFSSSAMDELRHFDELATKHCFSIKLGAGQGYIINNRRWLHGRTAFTGEREFLRLLVTDRYLDKKGISLHDQVDVPATAGVTTWIG